MKSNLLVSTLNGILALTASAALMNSCVTSGTNSSAASADMGECHGVNSCKGTGACGGKGNSCAGKNSCKGQGWLKLSKADCEAKSGKFKAG